MKRIVKSTTSTITLEDEANRVFDTLIEHPEVDDLFYDSDVEAFCIIFNEDAEDLTWFGKVIHDLGYSLVSENDEVARYASIDGFRAWLYEDGDDVELFITR